MGEWTLLGFGRANKLTEADLLALMQNRISHNNPYSTSEETSCSKKNELSKPTTTKNKNKKQNKQKRMRSDMSVVTERTSIYNVYQ